MSEGKFKKRIDADKLFTRKDTEVGEACHKRLEMFSEWVDEAKKEFPDIGELTNVTVSRFEMAAQDWFVKWFGSEEKKSEPE